MSNVINKSNHPVEIKKIALSIWSLRSEIEAAIAQRLSSLEDNSSTLTEPDIEDIKAYYTTILNSQPTIGSESDDEDRLDDNLDSSGNPMDDDAAEMLAALNGGADEDSDSEETEGEVPETEADTSESEPSENNNLEEDTSEDQTTEEDAAAAALAAEMLGDQGLDGDGESEGDGDVSSTISEEDKKDFVRPVPNKHTEAFLMLSDITMENCLLFTKGPFIQGQNIVIQFNIPNSFKLLATVIKCRDISRNSKIISHGKPSHRVYCTFEYKFPGERSALRSFLKSIEPTIPVAPKKMKRPETEEDDDDFDDLGF